VAPEGRHALQQFAGVTALVGIAVIGGVLSKESPADTAELGISVGELRSQAAELALIVRDVDAERLDRGSAQRHLHQLASASAVTRRDLQDLEVAPELTQPRAQALAHAEVLGHDFALFPALDAVAVVRLRDDLQRIEDDLHRRA